MINSIYYYLILLLLNIKFLLDNTLSNILFTEPKNKSDQTGLQQKEDFSKEDLKDTQSTNDWDNKEVVLC